MTVYPPAFGYETSDYNAGVYYGERLPVVAASHIQTALEPQHREQFIQEFTSQANRLPIAADVRTLLSEEVRLIDTQQGRQVIIEDVRSCYELIGQDPETQKIMYMQANCGKITGYFPLVGTCVGINRIAMTVKIDTMPIADKCANIFRGVLETFSLGFVLLPVDLIVTALR